MPSVKKRKAKHLRGPRRLAKTRKNRSAAKRRELKIRNPLVAIYDLTDCEGCELAFVPLIEDVAKNVDIVEWRLVQEKKVDIGDRKIDIAFVEGSPMNQHDRDFLTALRARTKTLVSLGACACVGGVPALAGKEEREKFMSLVYYPEYRPKSDVPAPPLDSAVKVDYYLHGCPVLPEMVAAFLEQALLGKKPDRYGGYTVCLPCKARDNRCLLLEGKPCLGPVSAGNCGAPCPSYGKICYGCLGPARGANFVQMRKKLAEMLSDAGIEAHLKMFLKDERSK
jgi:sulfhydrogenase subunit delta